MNELIKNLANKTDIWCDENIFNSHVYNAAWEEKFAELIVQACADYIRENMDSEQAEPLAFCMERDFGLHGDYAE